MSSKIAHHNMPRAARGLLRLILPAMDNRNLLGDYEEIYNLIIQEAGKSHADLWIVKQVLKSAPLFLRDSLSWKINLAAGCFKLAVRNLKRHKIYSFINIAGLALGLSISLILTLYVYDELTFDRFHEKPETIYRVLSLGKKRGTINSITAGPLIVAIKENIPEIVFATRIAAIGSIRIPVENLDSPDQDEGPGVTAGAIMADEDFFDVFSFRILKGGPGNLLGKPGEVFLTPRIAEAIFGDQDPVGRPLAISNIPNARVAGIVESPPSNSHIQFEMITALIPENRADWWDSMENLGLMGYIRTWDGAVETDIEKKMKQIAADHNFVVIFEPELQPLLSIHLGSGNHFYDYFNSGKNEKLIVAAMFIVGIMILIVACINFVNLSTSRSSYRAREVGMRKVVGSSHRQLVFQFLGESVILTFTTALIAITLVYSILPALDGILHKTLRLNFSQNPYLLAVFLLLAVILGILAGIYPAFVISSFKPVKVLRREFQSGSKGMLMRKSLVIFQFAMTTSLITGVFIVLAQINYVKSRDMGYSRERVLCIFNPVRTPDDPLKQFLKNHPDILAVGRIDSIPGPNFFRVEIIPEGFTREATFSASNFYIDTDLFATLQVSFLEGRNFSKDMLSDAEEGVIINETLMRKSNYSIGTGRTISIVDTYGGIIPKRVVGVIRDFHYLTARQQMEPMIFFLDPRQGGLLLVRIAPGKATSVMADIESQYPHLNPGLPKNIFFLDEPFNAQFNRDRNFMHNIGIFAGIAVFIAYLGLIGLVSYEVEQRRKEIVVRKLLGCGEHRIFLLLVLDFIKWVALSNLIAWPLAYFAMEKWLSGFVFRLTFVAWPFLIAAAATLLFALITISIQTLKAAGADPVEVLRQTG